VAARTPFVILTSPRSGSNWLITLLNQHPQMRCSFEVLHNQPDQRTPMVAPVAREPIPDRDRRYDDTQEGADFVRSLYALPYASSVRATGFKLFYDQAAGERARSAWSYLARNRGIHVIHLERDNLLAAFVSLQRALRTRVWLHLAKDGSVRTPEPETVDPEAFRTYVEEFRAERAAALARLDAQRGDVDRRTLTLTYEQLRAGRRHHVSRILRFLGIRPWPWVWRMKDRTAQQAALPLARSIANHQELVRQFAGTDLERYLIDPA
jgi:LPS sulfotransferase NodH